MVSLTVFSFHGARDRLTRLKAHEHCALLLAVDPKDEQERRQLTKEQEKLRKAQSWLENLTLAAEDGLNV